MCCDHTDLFREVFVGKRFRNFVEFNMHLKEFMKVSLSS